MLLLMLAVAAAAPKPSATGSYQPLDQRCPAGSILRTADTGLSDVESDWIERRDQVSQPALRTWLEYSGLDFDVGSYMAGLDASTPIRVGLAFSGGGFRAMLTGAGMLAALDSRVARISDPMRLGGLLQAASYISGLSGGSWLVGSVAANKWPTVPQLQASKDLWNFNDPFTPSDEKNLFGLVYDVDIAADITAKISAGYPVSIADIWGRMLSAQMLAGHGKSQRWSDLTGQQAMQQHSLPLPILVADGVLLGNDSMLTPQELAASANGELGLPINATVYEMTPFEFGSWDESVGAFVEMQFLGTELVGGEPTTSDCTVNYDNSGFLMGTSSSIFNEVVQGVASGPLKTLFNTVLPNWMTSGPLLNIALVGPNPFLNESSVDPAISSTKNLALVDGGENDENVPLQPLLVPERSMDVIFALDSSADTPQNWPNGSSLWTTYQRQLETNATTFPYIPPPEHMVRAGYNVRPTFFGCSVGDYTQLGETPPPLIVYMPNAKQSYDSNESTFKVQYSASERDGMITNGFNVMTQRNTTDWRGCVACATVLRSQQRGSVDPSPMCHKCFQQYCFDPPS